MKIRQIFAEIIGILCFSMKKHSFETIKIKKDCEFNITHMASRLKAPSIQYAADIYKHNDPKELYIAKYYIETQKWVPAMNRLKIIVKDYEKTIFIEEALHRLVEINYHIGLEQEAKKYAKILGYNYNSSQWFEQSYKILNKDYKIITKNKIKDNDGFFKRIIKKIR